MVNLNVTLRPAVLNDQGRIANLIYFESHVHRHLDWRSPLDWLGQPEYWVLEQGHNLAGVLACPSDPPGIAWIRLFAHAHTVTSRQAWQALWQVAREQVVDTNCQVAAAITLQQWFAELLQESGFALTQKIVVLDHGLSGDLLQNPNTSIPIRRMTEQDLPAVAALDAAAFQPIWQNSQLSLQMAFAQAGLATVIEEQGRLLGYQISTTSPFGMHLARLAVLPDYQERGLGMALVQNLLAHASQNTLGRITVNTQNDNQSSLSLYRKLGFRLTGEQYPVYVFSGNKP
jgi:ribosomal protein S18 acetylase RimI-like enzyme